MQGRRRSQVHAVLGVAIYALFLVTAPFEHHDLLCHLKTPSHCTACTSSVRLASGQADADGDVRLAQAIREEADVAGSRDLCRDKRIDRVVRPDHGPVASRFRVSPSF